MLLYDVLHLIPRPSSGRNIPKWTNYVHNMKFRLNLLKERMLPLIHETEPVAFFKQLLSNVPIYDLEREDDFDAYGKLMVPYAAAMRPFFDSAYNERTTKYFNNNRAPEYILNVSKQSPMTTLPFGETWEAWQNLKPFRVLSHDSTELPIPFYNDKLSFKEDVPSYTCYSLDIILLAYMWYKYYSEYKTAIEDPDMMERFIRQYLVVPMLDDLIHIHVFNMACDIIVTGGHDTKANQFIGTNSLPGAGAMSDLTRLASAMRKGRVGIENVLDTDFFATDTSLYDHIQELFITTKAPDLRQYNAVHMLAHNSYLSFILSSMSLCKRYDTSKMFNTVKFLLNRYKDMKIWSTLKSAKAKDTVRYNITVLRNIISKNR